jgi:biopolymer transport protein ExbB/TolQ
MALFRKSATPPSGRGGWLSGLLGSREIERRVDESFPTWDEFAEQKINEAQEREEESQRLNLPPHRVFISSPLHGNFLYFFLVLMAMALGLQSPELAPVLVYAAIGIAVIVSLFVVFRDALFFHIEGLRLRADSEMINKHARGPRDEREEKGMSFLRAFSRKRGGARNVFRSSLLQIHFQNVLRTFEQGNRRTWVDQDASIADLHTLLSQRGMKLVWTMIEVLPQLGLLGTLIGLMRMFLAFRAAAASPELEILAGFATALGTTVVANLIVLMLRPLYMRNERAMHEILSAIQSLMAMFILPTQQSVLERTMLGAYGRGAASPSLPGAPAATFNEARLYRTLEELTGALSEFTETQRQMDSGTLARETATIAQQVKETLRAFHDSVDRDQIEKQQRAIDQLSGAVRGLAANLSRQVPGPAAPAGPQAERIVHDLAQLRVLTHDTLLLLEQIAGRLDSVPERKGRLLTRDQAVRNQLFQGETAPPGLVELDEEPAPAPPPNPALTPSLPPLGADDRADPALPAGGRLRRRRS